MADIQDKSLSRRLLKEAFSREIQALFAMVSTLTIVSTFFYMIVEDWRLLDSLYFSVMTMTTVGYGDLVPTTDAGKIFTIFLVISGVGLVLTFLQALAKEQAKDPFINRIRNHQDNKK